MNAIIVDDELQSRQVLRELLARNHPEVIIVADGENVEEGCQLIRKYGPELVFLDIEMPDGLGFDLLEQMGEYQFQVIFITAHNEYAITAIKFGALDYLLKPVSEEELATALQKAHRKTKEKISEDQIQILLETLRNFEERKLPTRIAISTSEGILYKQVKDIVRLQAQQNYTEFSIMDHARKILASLNIGEYVEQFERYREFMKVHRSHLVNLHFVDRFVRADGGYLVMQDGTQVSVSRAYRDELLDRLEHI
ncbi:MAG: response regulator transcription factor [Phaeodactylibacter sp.]|nr:response regulator transcription factor [Phaeodactylibacter sp.]MCB9266737.1 response regulator transcription factor [Lewinellaceae bacterium]MCB9286607.1 response regulator transcription factor [Lewinellaceae bacterium]